VLRTRFDPYAEVLILAAKNDWLGLIPVAICPSNAQG